MKIANCLFLSGCAAGCLVLLLVPAAGRATVPAPMARGITLTAEDCDQMAAISPLAPRLSWALSLNGPGVYNTQPTLYFTSNISLLMRFPIKAAIPSGQRVTKAELSLAAPYRAGLPELRVRRILAEWGNGVCHQYCMAHPKKVEWAEPGCRSSGTDCAAEDSVAIKLDKLDFTLDLTRDVQLWHREAVPNHGWIFTVENFSGTVYLPSPCAPHGGAGKQWKLQISFEPN